MSHTYDIVVIGAGPGGYACALRAAQLGMRVACVEERQALGGTCLNVGCIPSKALLHASHAYAHTAQMADMGIKLGAAALDLKAMMAFKQKGVDANTKGVAYLFKKNGVEHIKGRGRIVASGRVGVGDKLLAARHVVIATGSRPAALPDIAMDEERIVSSTGALELARVPSRLVVIGAGYIGLEMGSVWARLGAKVTIIEYLNRILPGMDKEVASGALRIFKRQGLVFRLGEKLASVETKPKSLVLQLAPAEGPGAASTLEADVVLIATGRVARTEGLGLEAAGIKTDARGCVVVDGAYRTSLEGVYALGDVIAGPMLAHKATDEGVVLAECLAGQKSAVNYDVIPGVVYTAPEIASVGQTEEALKEAGVAFNKGVFPFMANGRAKVNATTEGFVKILADKATDRVLGVHIIGAEAGVMIAEAALAMEFGASAEDIARTCHAHPTLSEAMKEAALGVDSRALHM